MCIVSRLVVAAMMGAAILPVAPAAAQSFLQNLFGFGAPPKPSWSGGQPNATPLRNFGRAPLQSPHVSSSRVSRDGGEQDDGVQSSRGGYRTVCVRMCDGYYFPISNVSRRRDFYRDAKVCAAQCGEQGKLFYQAASDENMSELVDLQGRNYNKLPNAFLYRKQLVDGCSCRPMPWSASEQARHRQYALAEEAEKARQAEAQRVAALPANARPAARGEAVQGEMVQTAAVDASAPAGAAPSLSGAPAPGPEPQDPLAADDALEPVVTAPAVTEPPSTERPNQWRDPNEARREVRTRSPRRTPPRAEPAVSKPQGSGFGLFGSGGQPKYTWPGDAPSRPR